MSHTSPISERQLAEIAKLAGGLKRVAGAFYGDETAMLTAAAHDCVVPTGSARCKELNSDQAAALIRWLNRAVEQSDAQSSLFGRSGGSRFGYPD